MIRQQRRRHRQSGRFLPILILIFIALLVFEGNLLLHLFQKGTVRTRIQKQMEELFAESQTDSVTEPSTESLEIEPNTETQTQEQPETQTETQPIVSTTPQRPDSPCVVPEQPSAKDDAWFSDAVFIGDSRMEGFHIQSGLTQGEFLTGIGMDTTNIFKTPFIASPSGNITVFQAIWNGPYKKIYLLLGSNNLGEYNFDDFKETYRICIGEIKKMLPSAVVYAIEIPYVEDDKVAESDRAYINNANVTAANEKILEVCEENNYNYIAVNEVLSNGNGALQEGASSDGVHLYDTHCQLMLTYLKNHYIEESATP